MRSFLLMRPRHFSLSLSLFQLQQCYRYAPRSASSQFHSSSKDSASNIAIQLKHYSNTTGVPAVNSSIFFPSEWSRINEYQNAWLKTCRLFFPRSRINAAAISAVCVTISALHLLFRAPKHCWKLVVFIDADKPINMVNYFLNKRGQVLS